jgi:hypothetical protein
MVEIPDDFARQLVNREGVATARLRRFGMAELVA